MKKLVFILFLAVSFYQNAFALGIDNCNDLTTKHVIILDGRDCSISISCLPDYTGYAEPGICGRVFSYKLTVGGDCSSVTLSQTDGSGYTSGSIFPVGTTVQTWFATDASGNLAWCTFTVTILDNQKPIIYNCPPNITTNTIPDLCEAVVVWTPPTFSDNCGFVSWTQTHLPGTSFFPGTTTVQYYAVDYYGNTETCSFTITVIDAQSPSLHCPLNAIRPTDRNLCTYKVVGNEFNAIASDNCGIFSLVYILTGATTGSGSNTAGINLNKGINSILWKARDAIGNATLCVFTVIVNDLQAPSVLISPGSITVTTLPYSCTFPRGSLPRTTVTPLDNCGILSVVNDAPLVFPVGTTLVKWTVTDLSGNSDYTIQQINVNAYTCGIPLHVFHTEITKNSAKVKWNNGTCNNSYELRIRQEISPGVWGSWSAWTRYSGPAGPPTWTHLFLGLTPSKNYNYQIHSLCGATISSALNGFFTTLTPFSGDSEARTSSNQNDQINDRPAHINLVPNPATEFTTVIIEGFEQHEKTVTMFDLYGKLVFNVKIESNQNQLELDLSKLAMHKGVYLIRVSDPTKQKTEQLIIEDK